MIRHVSCPLPLAALLLGACAPAAPPPSIVSAPPSAALRWEPQQSGTTASLRGLSVVSRQVAWASGSGGTYLRTTDGGTTWQVGHVPGADSLDFRDVEGVNAKTAYLMSAGTGTASRIYKTTDGGQSWQLQHTNRAPEGFFDGMAFWNAERGLVYGDPVEGRFALLTTSDGGRSWNPAAPSALPATLPGEAAFAASGTGVAVWGSTHAWLASGGARTARVFRTVDGGRSWAVAEVPVRAGAPAAGVFSLAFADARHGVAVGGDYTEPDSARANAALSEDGGATWQAVPGTPPRGYRSGVAVVPGTRGRLWVTVGTSGADLSHDGGRNWAPLGTLALNSVAAAPEGGVVWAVGPGGRIVRLELPAATR